MDKITRNRLYKEALKKWGLDTQLDMIVEECAELIQAIQKLKRVQGNPNLKIENLASELADVEIMLEQSKFMLDWQLLKEKVAEQKELKLLKLQKYLQESSN